MRHQQAWILESVVNQGLVATLCDDIEAKPVLGTGMARKPGRFLSQSAGHICQKKEGFCYARQAVFSWS